MKQHGWLHRGIWRDTSMTTYPIMTEGTARLAAWSIAWEGSIQLNIVNKSKSEWKGKQFNTSIAIGNTNKSLIEQFKMITGYGGVCPNARKGNKEYCWRWYISSHAEIKAFLEQIVNYLPLKQEQGKLLLEYINIRLEEKRRTNQNASHTKREYEIAERMTELNKKEERVYGETLA